MWNEEEVSQISVRSFILKSQGKTLFSQNNVFSNIERTMFLQKAWRQAKSASHFHPL
jgi:hypothetical protein